MHRSELLVHIDESVAELRRRVASQPTLRVNEISLDSASLELFVFFEHELRATEAVSQQAPLLMPGGVRPQREVRIPIIGGSRTVRPLVLGVGLDDYDLRPPTAELLHARGVPLEPENWPVSFEMGGIVPNHPKYGRPFFCRRGLREYHEHEQHEGDPWVKYRNGLPLHRTIIELLEGLRTRWYAAA